jgi:uncharacterized protein DUF4328
VPKQTPVEERFQVVTNSHRLGTDMPSTVALAPVRHVAAVTSGMVVVTCVAGALGALTAWYRYKVAVDYVAGSPDVGVADYVSADNTAANVGVLWLIAYGVTCMTFLTWSWRARANAERLCPVPHRLSRGWVVGGWFVPPFPLIVLEDVWRTSRPSVSGSHVRELPKAWLVHYWWYAAVACALVGLWLAISRRGEPTLDALMTTASITTLLACLELVAAGLVITVIRQITQWQSTPRPA